MKTHTAATLRQSAKKVTLNVNIKTLREGYSTFDYGKLLEAIGRQLHSGFDVVLDRPQIVRFDKNGKPI